MYTLSGNVYLTSYDLPSVVWVNEVCATFNSSALMTNHPYFQLVGRVLGTLVLVHKRRPKPPMVKRPNSLIGSDTSQESMRMLNGRYGLDTCTQLQTGRFVYGNDVTDGGVAKLETRVRKLAKHIQETDEAMLSAPEKAFITQQWKYLAIVLDRFFFTVYFILIGLSLALLFPWPT